LLFLPSIPDGMISILILIPIPILEFPELWNRRVALSAVRGRLMGWKITIRNKTTIQFDYLFVIPFQECIPFQDYSIPSVYSIARRYYDNELYIYYSKNFELYFRNLFRNTLLFIPSIPNGMISILIPIPIPIPILEFWELWNRRVARSAVR
jgi:hypothetical protein